MEASLFSQYILPVTLALIMITLGLSLNFGDFKTIFATPKALITGLACQMLLLPAIAFTIASLSSLPGPIKLGIVLISICPGGATSNLITYLLKGDVALSISLTSINSILILFTIPAFVMLAGRMFMAEEALVTMPFGSTILKIFLMILLPTAVGIIIRQRFPKKAGVVEKYMKYITTILLAVVYLFVIITSNNESEHPMQLYLRIAPLVLLLNLSGMGSGYFLGRWLRFRKPKLVTLSVEVGIQNSALAITIASSPVFLNDTSMALPAVIYGMFTFFNAILFGMIVNRWHNIKGRIKYI
ncbi:MAG: bile acid:sodium symporter family protein [Bacteroidales bacterium]|nr:bile acid:sodium symporter family protein [Bacteroidales bacterium]